MKDTKKCKYCREEIDKKAKVCSHCKKNQTNPAVRIVLAIIGIVFIAGIIGNMTDDKTKDENKCYITLDEFNQLNNGMNYEEVKNIIGCDGTVNSDTSVGTINMKIYSWYGKDEISNANATFENDKMVNKTQIGLK